MIEIFQGCFSRARGRSVRRCRYGLLVGLLLAAGMSLPVMAKAADELPPAPVIRNIRQFWDLPEAAKKLPVSFDLECFVTYFDASWGMLFVQDRQGLGAYVPYGKNPFPFRPGHLIRARGQFLPPNADINFSDAKIEDLGPGWPMPINAAGHIGEMGELVTTFISMEGLVESYRRLAPHHVQISVSSEGRRIVVWLLLGPEVPLPDIVDSYVRVQGVYNAKRGPDGQLISLELMVPGLQQMQVLHKLKDDARFQLPLSAIDSMPRISPAQLVHIKGRLVGQEADRYVRIRDETGQIEVATGQGRAGVLNQQIEAVGYPAINGLDWKLGGGTYRLVDAGATGPLAVGAASGPLRLASQLRELSPDEAAAGREVHLNAVVTWSHPDAPFFFVQDSSGGVAVLRDKSNSLLRAPGRYLELEGVTALGDFAPVLKATRWDKLSDMSPPLARPVSLEHALTGVEEGQWVEIRGYLREAIVKDGWMEAQVATATGDFQVMLPKDANVDELIGAMVRVHGVCAAVANSERRLVGIRIWTPSVEQVQVEEPAPRDPFNAPLRPLGSLGQFSGIQTFGRRIRVAGTVLLNSPGHGCTIEEDGSVLQVLSRLREPIAVGERIEAVGFLGRQGERIVLREAVIRKAGAGRLPTARQLVPGSVPQLSLDGRLVALEGTVISESHAPGHGRLTLQSGETVFEAGIVSPQAEELLATLPRQSRVAVTGLYEVKYDEFGRPASFQLSLRDGGDIQVLETPSWWTRARILTFTAILALGTLLTISWVAALRRRVESQTEQIRNQLKREAFLEAELQRASKLESLGLLAGGIAHDFNNLLTVMMGNISLAGLDEKISEDSSQSLRTAEKAAVRARDLTQQLLTFAKGGAPIRGAVSLPEVVREVAEFALRGAQTRCDFEFGADLWPANVDKGQIGQVVQNIVINAMQAMATGGRIRIALQNSGVGAEMVQVLAPGRYLQLVIEDCGPGIPAEDLAKIFDPYFTTKKQGNGLGLATVYSIVKKHLGHITVNSAEGRGTKFTIWLPAADPEMETALAKVSGTIQPMEIRTARVLFMDDEESIRQLGCRILNRLGKEVTAVSDGLAAVQEYRRAREAGTPYDLVILDLTIPGGMGGRETIAKLRDIDPLVRAIVSSGYSNDLVLSDHNSHGFLGIVTKPYEIDDFRREVERVLRGDPPPGPAVRKSA